MTKKLTTTALDKLVADVFAITDPIDRVANATMVIARLRSAVSDLSADRAKTVEKAHANGTSYSALAEAAGMTAGRMSSIGTGRGGYVRKAAPAKAAKAAPAKAAKATKAPAKATPRKRTAPSTFTTK